jgi:hypothetical protein
MNMNNHDLDWLAEQQPQRRGTDKDAHDRALLALLRHETSRPAGHRRSRSRSLNIPGLLNRRLLAVATGTGVAAIAAAVALSAGNGATLPTAGSTHGRTLQAVVKHHAIKSPLIRLADNVSTSASPVGDATLIQRSTTIAGQAPITVYDLYGDDGTYYFSQGASGLPSQVSSGNSQADGLFGREVAAAKEAATGNVAQAAIDMANAPDPNLRPQLTPTNDGNAESPQATALAIQAKEKATGMHFLPSSRFDNYAWGDSQDAMIAGAGDPQVRAGVLKILATLPGVTVTQGSSNGTPTLVLTAGSHEFGMNYQEQLTVNAETGIPIEFVGGTPGKTAATTVDYQVKRVTLSDIAGGTVPSF